MNFTLDQPPLRVPEFCFKELQEEHFPCDHGEECGIDKKTLVFMKYFLLLTEETNIS